MRIRRLRKSVTVNGVRCYTVWQTLDALTYRIMTGGYNLCAAKCIATRVYRILVERLPVGHTVTCEL